MNNIGLLNSDVKIKINGRNIKYYKDKGYKIPQYKNKHNKVVYKIGATITVKIADLPHGSEVKVPVECDHCKQKYSVVYYDYLKHNHDGKTYCRHCYSSIFLSGENSPHWNINLTNEEREQNRDTKENRLLIQSVLFRDNYKCQCCGKNISGDKQAEVHHLDGWNWCIEKRYDVTNCVSLCGRCHYNFHMNYGRGNNTKQQFEEWIGYSINLLQSSNEFVFPTARKVICLDTGVISDAPTFAKELHCSDTQIYNCCNHKSRTCNKKHFLYKDEYDKMSKQDLENYLQWTKITYNWRKRKIICITTMDVFDSIKEASNWCNLSHSNDIGNVCRGNREYAGYHPITREKLQWMYLSDYQMPKNYINIKTIRR